MPGRDPIPVPHCHHPALRWSGSILRLRTRGPVRHRRHPAELLWGGAEPYRRAGRLYHVSWNRRVGHIGSRHNCKKWPKQKSGKCDFTLFRLIVSTKSRPPILPRLSLLLWIFCPSCPTGLTSSSTWSTASPLPSLCTVSCWWWRDSSPVAPSKTCTATSRSPPADAVSALG